MSMFAHGGQVGIYSRGPDDHRNGPEQPVTPTTQNVQYQTGQATPTPPPPGYRGRRRAMPGRAMKVLIVGGALSLLGLGLMLIGITVSNARAEDPGDSCERYWQEFQEWKESTPDWPGELLEGGGPVEPEGRDC